MSMVFHSILALGSFKMQSLYLKYVCNNTQFKYYLEIFINVRISIKEDAL